MTFVEVEPGVQCFAQDLGPSGAHPVVFIAGFGLSHPVWDGEVRDLLAAGHRVVCIDLRGTGRSDKPAAGYDVERLTQDVERVCDALGITQATFVGWSFGGQISFHLAATRPQLVAKLVLLASTAVRASRSDAFPFRDPPEALLDILQGGERRNRLRARRRTIAGGFATQPPDTDTHDFLIRVSLEMPSWAAVACYESYLLSDFVDEIERVTQPVLQIVGDSDPVTPLEAVEWLGARLADSRTTVLQGCGHYPMFEAGAELRAALVSFAAG
ncbi:MAG: alpha/beta fold hydrolase [Solirubrobacteraceae bacterium]